MEFINCLALIHVGLSFYWLSNLKLTRGFILCGLILIFSSFYISAYIQKKEFSKTEYTEQVSVAFVSLNKNIMTLKSSTHTYEFYIEKDVLQSHLFNSGQVFFIRPKFITNSIFGPRVNSYGLFRDLAYNPEFISASLKDIQKNNWL